MGWAGWAKSRGLSAKVPEFQAKKCVHVGETFNRFCRFGAMNCVWRPGSARTRWGSYSAPPNPLAVIRGRNESRGKKGLGIGRGKKGRGKCDGLWREGEEWGERARLGYLSIGPEFLVTPLH